jgi:hypothetical protein
MSYRASSELTPRSPGAKQRLDGRISGAPPAFRCVPDVKDDWPGRGANGTGTWAAELPKLQLPGLCRILWTTPKALGLRPDAEAELGLSGSRRLYGAGLSQNGKANRDPPDIVGINQASLDLLHRRIRRQASDYHGQFTCGIDPYGTIGRDLVPHPVHIGLEPPTWARPGANGTVADRSEPGSYRFPDTPTFTLDVDIRPEATGW